jgi:hypothetical protein
MGGSGDSTPVLIAGAREETRSRVRDDLDRLDHDILPPFSLTEIDTERSGQNRVILVISKP